VKSWESSWGTVAEKELEARNNELLTTNEEEKGSSKLTQLADLSQVRCLLAPDRNNWTALLVSRIK